MGLLRKREEVRAEVATIARPRRLVALSRPSSVSPLATVTTWPYLGTNRAAALAIPAVGQCRDLIVGAAVQMPLLRYRGTERMDAGTLLTQPDPDTTLAKTIAGTIEDLIYDGVAYWLVLARDGQPSEKLPGGFPVRARWIPTSAITPVLETDTGAYSRLKGYRIDGIKTTVEPHNVIRFDSPLVGVLARGVDAINNALELEAKALRLSTIDLPSGTLTNTGAPLTADELEALVQRFEEQRRTYGVAGLQDAEYARTDLSAEDLQLIEARANAATEMARLHNMPVTMISASPSGGASAMLYANLGAQLSLMVSSAVSPHLSAIEQTLSLPNVTPRGQAVAFDVAAFLRSDPDELKAYALDLLDKQVIDREECRQLLGIGAGAANLQPGTV